MSDETTKVTGPELAGLVPNELQGTVGFSRKVNLGNYQSAEASIFIQFPINPKDDGTVIIARAMDAFFQAKSVVFDQLGIEYNVEDGVIIESLRQQFGAVEVHTEAAAAAAPRGGKFDGLKFSTTRDLKDQLDDMVADLKANPSGWYDNRQGKRNEKAPDFKNKSNGELVLWVK